MPDPTAYWSAIAQIVPVIAVAFVLESRISARRRATASDGFKLRKRLAWAIASMLLWVSLVAAECVALAGLAFGMEQSWLVWLAGVPVVLGTVIVVGAPVTAIVRTTLSDWFFSTGGRLPWSPRRRLTRAINSFRSDMTIRRLSYRSEKIDLLRLRLESVSLPYFLKEVAQSSVLRVLQARGLASDGLRLHFEELEDELRKTVQGPENAIRIDALIEHVDKALALIDESIEASDQWLKKLADAATPAELDKLEEQTRSDLKRAILSW